MVIVSGIVTSRTSFSFGSLLLLGACVRCTRRRNEASERSRTSSALERGDERQAAARPLGRGLGGAASGAAAARPGASAPPGPRRTMRGPRFFLGFELRTRAAARAPWPAVSPSPKRFLATSSALRLVSSSCLRRSSSSRLRASAASRSVFSMASRCCADLRLFLGDLALLGLAQAGIAERVGAAAALFLGQRAQHDAGRASAPARPVAAGAGAAGGRGWRRGRRGALGGRGAGAAGAGAAASGLPSAPAMRRFLTSTTTCLLRPWLKLWRTTPVSVRGFSDSVVGADAQRLAVRGLGRQPFRSRILSVPSRPRPPSAASRRCRKRCQARKRAKNVSLAGPASRAACTTFDRPNAKSNWAEVKAVMTAIAVGVVRAGAAAPASLATPSAPASAACSEADDAVAGERRLDLGEAGRDQSRPCRRWPARRARRAPAAARSGRRDPASRATSRLKPRAKTLRATASFSVARVGRDPESAARQLALEVGHHARPARPRSGSARRPASPRG